MFTGIVEEIGIIKEISRTFDKALLRIECSKVLEGVKLGDSIAVNGVCQTVMKFDKKCFETELSKETLSVTTFSVIKAGEKVNLERALRLEDRLGGHLVSGHIDGIAEIYNIKKIEDFYNISIKIDNKFIKYIVKKGSVTIDGVSLTVADIQDNIVKIAIIPHTFNNTIFQFKKVGDNVNIEVDILAKYVEKMLCADNNKITTNFLAENGFI